MMHFFLSTAFLTILILFCAAKPSLSYVLTFTPRISLGQEYTDNLFLENDDIKENDYITKLSAGFNSSMTSRNSEVSLGYTAAYSNYNNFNELNALGHSANITTWTDVFKDTKLSFTDIFVRTEDPVTSIDDYDYVRRNRELYSRNTATVEIINQFGENNFITAGYTNRFVVNEDSSVDDNSSHNPYFKVAYWFVPNTWGVETGGEYTRGLFDNEADEYRNLRGEVKLIRRFDKHFDGFIRYVNVIMEYRGFDRDYTIKNPSAGIRWAMAEDSELTIDVGYFIQDREVGEGEEGLTVNGDLGTVWRFKQGSVGFGGSSGYRESYLYTENLGFSVYYSGRCNAEYNFTKHTAGNLYLTYVLDNFKGEDFGIEEREDRNTRAGCSVVSQLQKGLFFKFEYLYRLLDSTIDENDYQENRVLFEITITPSSPYRIVR